MRADLLGYYAGYTKKVLMLDQTLETVAETWRGATGCDYPSISVRTKIFCLKTIEINDTFF